MTIIYSEWVFFKDGDRKEANNCKRFNIGGQDHRTSGYIQLYRQEVHPREDRLQLLPSAEMHQESQSIQVRRYLHDSKSFAGNTRTNKPADHESNCGKEKMRS